MTPRHPLVEVVVGVDQTGGDDVAVDVDDGVARLGLHGADGRDAAAVDRDVTWVSRTS